jgi:hypothetical protein
VELFYIHVRPNPILGGRRVSLTGEIFGEEYIPGQEGLTSSVAKSNVDAPGEGNDPAATWRVCDRIVNRLMDLITTRRLSVSRPGRVFAIVKLSGYISLDTLFQSSASHPSRRPDRAL